MVLEGKKLRFDLVKVTLSGIMTDLNTNHLPHLSPLSLSLSHNFSP